MYELSWNNKYAIQKVAFVPVGDRYALIDAEDRGRVGGLTWYICKSSTGINYAYGFVYPKGKQTCIYMHRLVLDLGKSKIQADHKNFNGLDNRKSNLRRATHRQNLQNRAADRNKVSSRYKGVHYDKRPNRKKPWYVKITSNGKNMGRGNFKTEQEAALVYNELAKKHFGEFAYLNKIKN